VARASIAGCQTSGDLKKSTGSPRAMQKRHRRRT
jgi:hypothetical protein